MKLRKPFCLMAIVLALVTNSVLVYAQDGRTSNKSSRGKGASQAQSSATEKVSNAGPDLGKLTVKKTKQGTWFWGMLGEQALLSGATAIAVDASNPSTLYVGGVGYVAVSRDHGVSWTKAQEWGGRSSSASDSDELYIEDGLYDGNDNRAEVLREYIKNEVIKQVDLSELSSMTGHSEAGLEVLIEDMLNDVPDEELLEADNAVDLDIFKKFLGLEIELQIDIDLKHASAGAVLDTGLGGAQYDPFSMRYLKLMRAGADSSSARFHAARNDAVWQFVTAPDALYAVTSDAIYVTRDQGNAWERFLQSSTDENILSMHVEGQRIWVGTTNGLKISRDLGQSWHLTESVSGGIFEIHHPQGSKFTWALSTDGLYLSDNDGMSWRMVDVPIEDSELITSIVPGNDGRLMVITNESLYYSPDRDDWNIVEMGPAVDAIVRQVIPLDPALSSFLVRTDSKVFEYSASKWSDLNSFLYPSTKLGELVYSNNGVFLALMATSDGIWMAQDKYLFEQSAEIAKLQQTWSEEPTDLQVLERAWAAHYLTDLMESRWGLRSRLSWLLPVVTFDYMYKYQIRDSRTTVFSQAYGYSKENERIFAGETELSDTHTTLRTSDFAWQIMARWNINIGKGFVDEESDVTAHNNAMRLHFRVSKEVSGALNKRRALQLTMALKFPKVKADNKKLSKQYPKLLLGIQEQEAILHYLTGGYYIPAVHQDKNK